MPNRRLLIFQETPLHHTHASNQVHSPTLNPLTPGPASAQAQAQAQVQAQYQPQFQYTPINKLGLPIHGPGSLPEGLGLPSLLGLPLRVLNAFTEIFNAPKYKGWAIVAAGPYNDPTLGMGMGMGSPGGGGTGKFYAVVLEQVEKADGGLGS
ncbi:uncharacterized protein BJX67DRAFT_376905 [Aspergillus lucknowensis]|uniref:Uncharacterized protein n=1 Tax=Aspergillus lucknowensis TaxID=176173 RepID=A0ABR4M646_9EURO